MTKHTPEPMPKIEPYVTAKGGVVILNGPFPLDQAERVRALCEAAPAMLEALRKLVDEIEFEGENGSIRFYPNASFERNSFNIAKKAIAQAEKEIL